MRGFTSRQPRAVSTTSPGRAHGVPGLFITQGDRVIDSTPPATTRAAWPVCTSWAADSTACRPEAQSRLTVKPGTASGRPGRTPAPGGGGEARDRQRQAGEQHGHAGDVAVVLAGLVRGTEDDLVDRLRRRAGAVQ